MPKRKITKYSFRNVHPKIKINENPTIYTKLSFNMWKEGELDECRLDTFGNCEEVRAALRYTMIIDIFSAETYMPVSYEEKKCFTAKILEFWRTAEIPTATRMG